MMDESEVSSIHKCNLCEKTFSRSSNLYAHIRKIHKTDISFPIAKISCSLCEEKFCVKSLYEDHLIKKHDLKIVRNEYKFDSLTAFYSWKLNVEKDAKCTFVKNCGAKKKDDVVTTYYYCHRSGVFKSKSQGLRRIKIHGSNMIGANCPAMMKVTNSNNNIVVLYTETHVGHEQDIRKLLISNEDKLKVSTQLQMNIPIEKILDHLRDSFTDSLEPIHLTTRRDILNIKKKLNIAVNDGVIDANDAESVRKWVEMFHEDLELLAGKRHELIINVSTAKIFQKENQNEYFVPSMSNKPEIYKVTKISECNKDCLLMCLQCENCLHNLTCTCLDYCIRFNMCKHIHLVCMMLKEDCFQTRK